MDKDLAAKIEAMQWYKDFEPYIDPKVTLEDRMKGNITLTADAPKEAQDSLARWKARKLSDQLF